MKKKLALALASTTALALVLAPAALATLFLTIGGVRYLLAGGDPAALERAKGSIKAAIIGYALALLAPVLATVVQHVVGG